MIRSTRHLAPAVLAGTFFAAACAAALAQGVPSSAGAMRQHGGSIIRQDAPRRPDAPTLLAHPFTLLAAALEKEAPAMNLAPAALAAMQSWARDMKDFAGLEDRRTQQRMGWTQGAVHASVDLGRDLSLLQEGTHELDGAASDVASGWKKLAPLLDEGQRRRVEALYGTALLESRRPPAR